MKGGVNRRFKEEAYHDAEMAEIKQSGAFAESLPLGSTVTSLLGLTGFLNLKPQKPSQPCSNIEDLDNQIVTERSRESRVFQNLFEQSGGPRRSDGYQWRRR
ncbi:hypothetical protein F0562_017944 [Nyssa sinensis]|uniref:Uncharacterized protein n=1 Tax=Nyssa sinensis TaxID=561372 RepID=A0A5J4Z849_9ASTE|nr:hypothetical protein F0562_017944 [Nyssa sinensis]